MRMKHRQLLVILVVLLGVIVSSLGLQGCQPGEQMISDEYPVNSGSASSPSLPLNPEEDPSADSFTDNNAVSTDGFQPVWGDFQPPSIDPATPIPPPEPALNLDEEILVWVLLGSDTEPPFIGKTPSIHLLFIHPRFSKASLVSIPGDLYVYIPGYTMQRINTAYSVGGIETLRKTLAFNFGITPSRFVLAHPGDFQWLVDDINTIDVTVFYPLPQTCGGIRAGLVNMDGALALCYASFREDMDEVDRMRRQQQLMRIIFRKLTQDGNLIQLPVLFTSYEGWVKTDLSLTELMARIPLALRLADPDRIKYFMLGWDQVRLWEVPGYSQAQVFLPNQAAVRQVFQQALDHIVSPQPLTNQVQTLEAQLTAAYYTTASPEVTFTPTSTPTPTVTPTIDSQSPTSTPTITPPGYP